ncbi:GntR family transcriptional regulator [Bacillaceae bacterium W0354]
MTLGRIKKKSISDLTYEQLKESIIKGYLVPEQRLNEVELAEKLGVSRTPIRDALTLLQKEGWIVKRNSKLFVAPVLKEEVKNLFFIREYLEALSLNQAMLNKDDEFVNQLEEINEKLTSDSNPNKVVDYGQEFHDLILKQANNPILERILQEIEERIEFYRRLSVSKVEGRSKKALEEHKEIIAAIRNDNIQEAEEAMRKHIQNSYKNIILSN